MLQIVRVDPRRGLVMLGRLAKRAGNVRGVGRFVPYGGLAWCLEHVDAWLSNAGIVNGAVYRGFRKAKPGAEKPVRPSRLSVRAVQEILKRYPIYAVEDVLTSPALPFKPTPLKISFAVAGFAELERTFRV